MYSLHLRNSKQLTKLSKQDICLFRTFQISCFSSSAAFYVFLYPPPSNIYIFSLFDLFFLFSFISLSSISFIIRLPCNILFLLNTSLAIHVPSSFPFFFFVRFIFSSNRKCLPLLSERHTDQSLKEWTPTPDRKY